MRHPSRTRSPLLYVALISACTALAVAEESPTPSAENENEHETESEHGHAHEPEGEVDGQAVRFSHPLTFLSPTPETLLRLDHVFHRIHDSEDKAREHGLRFTAEYAFHPTFSMEVEAPYIFRDPDDGGAESNFDEVKVGAHFANLEFVDRGLIVGYGLEVGLPTGDDDKHIGSNNVLHINPFLSMGYVKGRLELASVMLFTIPTNEDDDEEIENEFEYDFGIHYWFSPRFIGFAELNGATVMNGHEEGQTVIGINPGLKVRPTRFPIEFAFGIGFPVTGREEYEVRTFFSLFYFF